MPFGIFALGLLWQVKQTNQIVDFFIGKLEPDLTFAGNDEIEPQFIDSPLVCSFVSGFGIDAQKGVAQVDNFVAVFFSLTPALTAAAAPP